MTIPPFYSGITEKYYGPPVGTDSDALWEEFRLSLDLPPGQPVPENEETEKLYLNFLGGKVAQAQESEAVNALSAVEIEKRKVVMTVFDILLTILDATTFTQIYAGRAVDFDIRKRAMYADLLSKVVPYIGIGILEKDLLPFASSDDSYATKSSPNADPKAFGIGYSSLVLQDVFKWLYDNRNLTGTVEQGGSGQSKNPIHTFTLSSGYYNTESLVKHINNCTISLQRTEDQPPLLEAKAVFRTSDTLDTTIATWSGTVLLPEDASEETVCSTLNTVFRQVYDPAKEAKLVDITPDDLSEFDKVCLTQWTGNKKDQLTEALRRIRDIKVPYRMQILAYNFDPPTTNSEDIEKVKKIAATRAQENQKLAAYMEAIKSRMEVCSDRADQQQQVIDNSISSRKMIGNILQSTIRQLRSIISSIFS